MTVGTLGTLGTTSLAAITYGPAIPVGGSAGTGNLAPADLAAIANSIVGDRFFDASNPAGIIATGDTHTNTTLDTLVAVDGGPLASIQIGALVLAVNGSTGVFVVPPGAFVIAKPSATEVTLSTAATASLSGAKVAIINPMGPGQNGRLSFNGLLDIPGRGTLKVFPGDVVALDSTGWPVLISAASIAYGGTLWSLA